MDFGAGWDNRDTGLLTAALAATYADTLTTKEGLKGGGLESNPLLGKTPSGSDLDRAALASGIIGSLLAGAAPPEMRRAGLGAWAGLETGLAYQNSHTPNKTKGKPESFEKLMTRPLASAALGALGGYLTNKMDSGNDVSDPLKRPGLSAALGALGGAWSNNLELAGRLGLERGKRDISIGFKKDF